ncbi:Uncharacterized protein Fot_07016 [Forsythia ovata]|uniref:Uncharacterized protein n=1 Tax=Forsythia ovata TaxID=205694 RepID=A0ABD1WUY9_9LAMI
MTTFLPSPPPPNPASLRLSLASLSSPPKSPTVEVYSPSRHPSRTSDHDTTSPKYELHMSIGRLLTFRSWIQGTMQDQSTNSFPLWTTSRNASRVPYADVIC